MTISEESLENFIHIYENDNNWDKLKKEEKIDRKSVLDGITKSQSALMAAQKISKKVVKVGFEWDSIESLKECIKSEYKEFEEVSDFGYYRLVRH